MDHFSFSYYVLCAAVSSPRCLWGRGRNSLSRKGKVEDTKEDNMDVVVAIHNNMNEFTWRKILQWEKLRT